MEEKVSIEITADKVITVEKSEYDELRRKANAFDILEADIRMTIDEGKDYSPVDDELVMLLIGMKPYQLEKRREKARKYAEKIADNAGEDEDGE